MNFKLFKIIIFLILTNCTIYHSDKKNVEFINKKSFINKGFALLYSNSLYEKKIITKKINDRDLIIFQKNLKKGTSVRIKNILNDKTILAIVGYDSKYPSFNNAVISKRIFDELEINPNEPYIEILEIHNNSSFIAKKTKTFDEEKTVAEKAPVESISIKDLNKKNIIVKTIKNEKFTYIIKVADFYFEDTAKSMITKIKEETEFKKPKIIKISNNQFRVFLGPFNNINSLQNAFNVINILHFENIEIIKK
jgi:hypothetical protein